MRGAANCSTEDARWWYEDDRERQPGTKIDKAYFVSLLRAANGGKRYLKMQSDEASKAAAWAGDDDEYGGGGGSSDDDMDDDDEPHIPR